MIQLPEIDYISQIKFKRRRVVNKIVKNLLVYTKNLSFVEGCSFVETIIQQSKNSDEIKNEIFRNYCERKYKDT